MEDIINALLDIVKEQKRSGIAPEAAMSRSDVVNMALKMMEQNGTDIEQETVTDTWRTVLRMAPTLFGTDTSDVPPAALSPSQQIMRKIEPANSAPEPADNLSLDKMILENFQSMMGTTEVKEIKTESETPKAPPRPKSAAELAADAIREADENRRKGIKPQQKKSGNKKPVTSKVYKGIPKAATNIKPKDVQGKSASQLAYEAQKSAQQRAAEEARIRAEMEEKMAKEAMARGEKDPRIVAEEERAKRAAAIREMEIIRAAERGEAPPDMENSCANLETEEERKVRIAREQEERRKKEWEEAEREAKEAKARAAREREERYKAEQKAKEEAAKRARELAGMSPEERKAAEERAARREKARQEAQAAKEAKSEKTKSEAAKLIQERAAAKSAKAQETAKKAVASIQQGMAAVLGGDVTEKLNITEEELNKLVMEKYQDLIRGGAKPSEINMTSLTTMVIDALSQRTEEPEEDLQEDLDQLMEEAWGTKEETEKPEEHVEEKEEPVKAEEKIPVKQTAAKPAAKTPAKPAVKKQERKEKSGDFDEEKLFASFKSVKSIFGDFEEYLSTGAGHIQTGIPPVDQLLSEGLEPGLFMVQAAESIGAENFQLQAADHIAGRGQDVIYLLSDSSRYGMMVRSISRLTYTLRGMDKSRAKSATAIMRIQSKEEMMNFKEEFAHYEGKIGEHLYLMEQKQMDSDNILAIIGKVVETYEKEKNKKPVVMIDDIYWMISEEPELIEELADVADALEIPIMISIGAGKINDSDFISTVIKMNYAGVTEENQLEKELQAEKGETLLADLKVIRKETGKTLNARMSVVPKFHYFGTAAEEEMDS